MIDISIDAYTPETYAKIRRGGNLKITRHNILELLKWVKKNQCLLVFEVLVTIRAVEPIIRVQTF